MRLHWRILWIAALVTALWLLLPLVAKYPIAHAATLDTATSTSTTSSAVVAPSSTVVPGIGPDCKGDPPLPATPGALLGVRPAVTSTQDPFTTPGVSIASVYGTSYRWWWYDNGCGAGSDILPSLTTNIANVAGLQLPGLLLSLGQGLYTAVIDPSGWIGFLDKPIADATASVAAGVWFPFLTLALLIVAVVMLWRAAHGRLGATITASVWALTVLVLVTWVVSYPSESVKLMDSGIQTAVITTAYGFNHPDNAAPAADETGAGRDAAVAAMDATWDTLNRSTVYRSWLAGVFGNPDSATATTFGPSVFKATHFTWAEYDTYQRDPAGAGKSIVDRKATEFRRLATQVQAADPVAYQSFTGNNTGDRLGVAFLCLLLTAVTTVFFLLAGLLTVLGYVVARLVVPVTPAAGVLFLLDSFRDLAVSWGARVVRVLVMGPVAFLAALVLFAFTRAIVTSTMSDGLKYLFILGLSWLAWRLLRPHTALGRMHIPGKKLIAQVVAMKLAMPHRTKPSSEDSTEEDTISPDPALDGPAGSGSAPSGGAGDRPVHVRAVSSRQSQRTSHAGGWGLVDYGAASAVPGETPCDLGTVEAPPARSPLGTRATPVYVTDHPSHAGHGGRGTRTALTDLDDPASGAAGPIAVSDRPAEPPVHAAASSTPASLPTAPRPPATSPAAGSATGPAGPRVVEGQLLAPGQSLPVRVNEANLTRDEHGRVVFQVYRPEGSRFYAQDE